MSFDEDKKKIIEIIKKYLPNCKIYLFGSRPRKKHRQGADIDLALDNGKAIDFENISQISADIDDTNIPFLVDIVDMWKISTEMKNLISKEMKVWKL